jgi:lipoic acid synthetase
MILGSKCTRKCGFCSIESAYPDPVDPKEPERIAIVSQHIGLRYVVITSVTRDDLEDGGAGHFAMTVSSIKRYHPFAKIEVLTPDFQGNKRSLDTVLHAKPDVFTHNLETVKRLYRSVRPFGKYQRSLNILRYAKEKTPEIYTKSGVMIGLGERADEIVESLSALRDTGCDFLTIGQYLRPSRTNLPVMEYIHPEIFNDLRSLALSMGFRSVASAPLVRSSMNAEEMYNNGMNSLYTEKGIYV